MAANENETYQFHRSIFNFRVKVTIASILITHIYIPFLRDFSSTNEPHPDEIELEYGESLCVQTDWEDEEEDEEHEINHMV